MAVGAPTGTVTFSLYDNPNGTGTPLFTDTETLSGGTATSAVFTTTAAGTDYWVATYNGFVAKGGAVGVGSATTRAVVTISALVLVSDYALSALFFY